MFLLALSLVSLNIQDLLEIVPLAELRAASAHRCLSVSNPKIQQLLTAGAAAKRAAV